MGGGHDGSLQDDPRRREGRAGKCLEHSLEACCAGKLGVELNETHQASDWYGDLSEEMLSYAATDAEVLLPLRKASRRRTVCRAKNVPWRSRSGRCSPV